MHILITGSSGFIGYHLALRLLKNKRIHVTGIDNLNDYYDVRIKKLRLKNLKKNDNFIFHRKDITDQKFIKKNFKEKKYDIVIHLAAQASIRLKSEKYIKPNIIGFYNIIEAVKENSIKRFYFASSSSVYGENKKNKSFIEKSNTDKPISFYASTKKYNELLAYTYSNNYKFECTGFRFFTVYGPLGRPDMAIYKFVEAMNNNKEIELYNNGDNLRDFTYIDDVIDAIMCIINSKKKSKENFNIYNIGNSKPISVKKLVKEIAKYIKTKYKIVKMSKIKGDVSYTRANIDKIKQEFNWQPKISINQGLKKFIKWYEEFNKNNN